MDKIKYFMRRFTPMLTAEQFEEVARTAINEEGVFFALHQALLIRSGAWGHSETGGFCEY